MLVNASGRRGEAPIKLDLHSCLDHVQWVPVGRALSISSDSRDMMGLDFQNDIMCPREEGSVHHQNLLVRGEVY